MSFKQKLNQSILKSNSLLCVGLDPDINKIPNHLLEYEDPVYEFCREIIEQTKNVVCAYKPNIAFFESFGESGWKTLRKVMNEVPSSVFTIADAKRGDIGNTSERYAHTFFDEFNFDCITVSPYMGLDSVEPFFKRADKSVFLLALTSNAGSADFQRLKQEDGKFVYQTVVEKAAEWNKHENIGLVVGATHPAELKAIRSTVPDMPFLIPGIGAQGGDLKETVAAGLDKYRRGSIINVSRDIIYTSHDKLFGEAARKKAIDYQSKINQIRFTVAV